MIKLSPNIFNISLCFALISAILFSLADFDVACDDLRKNVLRLHIIANSDSKADQKLKLEIRDEILNQSGDLFENVTDVDTAVKIASAKANEFCEIANRVILENGFSYKAEARVEKTFFETRVYDDFTLPAGVYEALVITLGKAKGKNWWCVIYPEVCIPAAVKGDLEDTVSKNSADIAKSKTKYIAKFKIVEIYEQIKKYIK